MASLKGSHIEVTGIVQGVGFRPFIFSLAKHFDLSGWVLNNSRGVAIEVFGDAQCVDEFVRDISKKRPPHSRIDTLSAHDLPYEKLDDFQIKPSESIEGQYQPVSPDLAICSDCRQELFDKNDRRYRYPFVNCTNCGPRFTIIKTIPYDRPNTTMADFPMCDECKQEYENPLDRRFHAQPIACPNCGPQLTWIVDCKQIAAKNDALIQARSFIKQGKIVALKGLGGYHLVCDASSEEAVARLRGRKKRSDKPFALMAFDVPTIRKHCNVSTLEHELLIDSKQPIVILNRLPESSLPKSLAPNQNTLGFMLPYTPLHLLVCEPEPGFPEVLVMTSGNLSDEPIAYKDQNAFESLESIADGFLIHDREIETRVDDSLIRVAVGNPYLIRRSRGYSPDNIDLPVTIPSVLAIGAELKNTFCLTKDQNAFVSHYIGDVENYETLQALEAGIDHYKALFKINPVAIAADLHPDYLATKFAKNLGWERNLPLFHVQHHHAHIAACMAENGCTAEESVIGFAFDGTGYGEDGNIWGSEVLICDYAHSDRIYHLDYVPQPSGDAAAKHVSRMALSYLWHHGIPWDEDLPPVAYLCADERSMLNSMLTNHINSPLTSSMGRLFDAVSSLLGVCQLSTYEGQAAIELEAIADPNVAGSYCFPFDRNIIRTKQVISDVIIDCRAGVPRGIIAAKFHNSVVNLIASLAGKIRSDKGLNKVALSGGVWQNIYLLERTIQKLNMEGFQVLIHNKLPANDSCVSLGQAVVAGFNMKG